MLFSRARAKINLSLSVRGRRADGFHDLASVVAFARFGDALWLEPGDALSLTVEGPTAQAAGSGDDNLVLSAARNLAERVPGLRTGAFALVKRLPVAAGLGGGSSDAAAALRLLARANALSPDDPRLMQAAIATGSDVPVCLAGRVCVMSGAGADLGPPLALPPLYVVLANPGVAVETRRVFAAMGLKPGATALASPVPKLDATTAEAWIAALKRGGNDMEDAACSLAPVIVDVLAVLAAARGCGLARMSGSGATCFGLFWDRNAAARAARAIQAGHPDWWVKASVIG